MNLEVVSPTRVDLAGGTLDCWPLYLLLSDFGINSCQTINLSISVDTQVQIETHEKPAIRVNLKDLNYEREFLNLEDALECRHPEMALVQAHLRYFRPDFGFNLSTSSKSPVGGGLGGSSSLCISLIKTFLGLHKKSLSLNELVTLASSLEAQVLKKPTGTQDYYPAACPGVNVIRYSVEGRGHRMLDVPAEVFSSKMLLVYTGKQHHSGINNWQVIQNAINGDRETLKCLAELARVSDKVVTTCETRKWEMLKELFQEEYYWRIRLCEGFNSPEIKRLEQISLAHGAEAIKICGAGGGGCVIVWVPPQKMTEVKQECQRNGFQVLSAQPVLAK